MGSCHHFFILSSWGSSGLVVPRYIGSSNGCVLYSIVIFSVRTFEYFFVSILVVRDWKIIGRWDGDIHQIFDVCCCGGHSRELMMLGTPTY